MPESKTLRQIAVDYNYPSSSEDNNDVDALTVRSQESSDEDPPRNNKSLVKNKLQRNRGYGWCIGIVAVGLLVTVGVASYHFGSKHQQEQVIQPSVPQPLSMPWSEGADPDKPQPKTTKGTGEQAGSYRFDEPVWRELHGFVLDDEGAELSSFDTIQPDSCTSVCDKTDNCNSVTICKVPNGVSCHLKTAKANGLTPRTHNKYCSTHIKSDEPYLPGDVRLNYPSDGETYTVYMYRAKNDGPTYNLENVNTASIGAVMWYLHNEVIYVCDGSGFFSAKSKWGDRKFAIDRIQRYKVSFKSTTPILEMGMNLSSYLSIDSGETTGPHLYSEISGKGTGSSMLQSLLSLVIQWVALSLANRLWFKPILYVLIRTTLTRSGTACLALALLWNTRRLPTHAKLHILVVYAANQLALEIALTVSRTLASSCWTRWWA